MQFSQNELNGVRQPNQLIKNMIGIKVWEHLTLVPYSTKDFRWTSWIFSETRSALFSPPTKWLRPGRGVWRSTRFCLRACITWSFLLGLRLLSRKWIADHILCHKQPRKPSDSWQCEQDKRVLQISCLRLFKTHFFRVKLQTSLYHPIPLDSKPYKQTNRLENLLLFEACYYFSFFVCFVLSCFI